MPKHTESQIAEDFGARFEKTNSGEFLGSIIIISIALLVAYGMHLWQKTKSPTAQAENNLKADFTNKHAELDKRVALFEQDLKHLRSQMIAIEMNINQQFSVMHDRLGKIEETMIRLSQTGRIINKDDI
jgi:ABC-type Zn2+ transport system substrate-binding protein/surface adhesin